MNGMERERFPESIRAATKSHVLYTCIPHDPAFPVYSQAFLLFLFISAPLP